MNRILTIFLLQKPTLQYIRTLAYNFCPIKFGRVCNNRKFLCGNTRTISGIIRNHDAREEEYFLKKEKELIEKIKRRKDDIGQIQNENENVHIEDSEKIHDTNLVEQDSINRDASSSKLPNVLEEEYFYYSQLETIDSLRKNEKLSEVDENKSEKS